MEMVDPDPIEDVRFRARAAFITTSRLLRTGEMQQVFSSSASASAKQIYEAGTTAAVGGVAGIVAFRCSLYASSVIAKLLRVASSTPLLSTALGVSSGMIIQSVSNTHRTSELIYDLCPS